MIISIAVKLINFSYFRFISPRTVDFTLTLWLDKVKQGYNTIRREFSKLDTFINHVKPGNIVSSDDMKIIQELVKSALECHLNNTEGEKMDKTLCQLCVLKDKLGSFECLIFDRVMNAVTNVLHGTWNPSYQENILRCKYKKIFISYNFIFYDNIKQIFKIMFAAVMIELSEKWHTNIYNA